MLDFLLVECDADVPVDGDLVLQVLRHIIGFFLFGEQGLP